MDTWVDNEKCDEYNNCHSDFAGTCEVVIILGGKLIGVLGLLCCTAAFCVYLGTFPSERALIILTVEPATLLPAHSSTDYHHCE